MNGSYQHEDVLISRVGLGLFLLFFTYCFAGIAGHGTIIIDPASCKIVDRHIIAAQIGLWLIPIIAAVAVFVSTFYLDGTKLLTGNPVSNSDQFENKPRKYVQVVYKDILAILAALFATLIAFKSSVSGQAASPIDEIASLLSDGLGVAAFFGVALFAPGFIFRLFGVGPDAADDD